MPPKQSQRKGPGKQGENPALGHEDDPPGGEDATEGAGNVPVNDVRLDSAADPGFELPGSTMQANWMTPELFKWQLEFQAREREKEREHELLLIHERLRASSQSDLGSGSHTEGKVDEFRLAKKIQSTTEKMPSSNVGEQLPSWFRNVEKTFELYEIPEELRGKLLLPLLNFRARALISHLGSEELADYGVVKTELLKAHKLSAREYRTKFLSARKSEDESWANFTNRLQDIFELYLESREVGDMNSFKQLMIADALKDSLRPDMKIYVLLQEGGKKFLAPSSIADLCEKFEEAEGDGNYRSPKPDQNFNPFRPGVHICVHDF